MKKTCFVIMGYGIKNNLNLDLTYEKIIKPCIKEKKLVPFPLYNIESYNAFRCDEISGTTAIDYKFVTCLNGSDIVIADISTMNVNAIYELGARHALKPRSTILLCSQSKEQDFKFFDLTYVPIIFYEHNGNFLKDDVVSITKERLNNFIDFAINDKSNHPDNPIHRALNEKALYDNKRDTLTSIYQLYKKGREELDSNDFQNAENTFQELYANDPSEENLLLLVLAKYKIAEINNSCKGLNDCIDLIRDNVDVNNSTSEKLYGRLAAISLRIFNIYRDMDYYYSALDYYRRGAFFCKKNLYCPRNYCALLLRIYEVTDDKNIIREYYYTAKHYAKLYIDITVNVKETGNYEDKIYYTYNRNDLKAIIEGNYVDFEEMFNRIMEDNDVTKRQKETITNGMNKLKESLEIINSYI